MKVLVVEDNQQIAETISDYLELEGFTIDCCYHGEAALSLASEHKYDVIIMDIMMPKLDGILTTSKLRKEFYCGTPILFLTAKDALEDKISAFKAGGDDYLVKPFAMEELVIRLIALSHRGERNDIGLLTFDDITINTESKQAFRKNKPIKLTQIQYKILTILIQKAPNLVSRSEVIHHVWGEEIPSSDALRSHVYGLRLALDKGFEQSRLETVHGQGYRIKP
ncbi:response regulator transcription factor [Vibrio sp. ZSDE26]|uniref:Response regulator transcription factor n=1 Tax=Vibrio amylolyticus TaxID=2847292 RepID=A0A9X1XK75_9VIBR|nr:response regulator transcription factor [Vibrio amylolyticus]MCK6264241.1 response regulator transcription factor [Vibrio amylolyticus]